MKLVRYGPPGKEKPGLIDAEGKLRDLSRKVKELSGAALAPAALAALRKVDAKRLPLVRGRPRLGPCVAGVGKFIAIGLNFVDHAKETGSPIPRTRSSSSSRRPASRTERPGDAAEGLDAVRLGGRAGRRHRQARALRRGKGRAEARRRLLRGQRPVEREFQLKKGGGQWGKGKGCDTFGPLGPWLVTADEVKDPQNLKMWLTVNGKTKQDGSTGTMIFGVAKLIADVSRYMTLEPGDVITTGTPPGVGMGQKPTPQYLKAGDVIELGVEGLGTQKQKVVAFKGKRT